MKLKVFFVLYFLINNYSVSATPALPFYQTEITQLAKSITEELQHNLVVSNLTKFQRSLNENLSTKIKELKDQKNSSLLFSILIGSFIYGIFHALGPGHGKTVISSWIIGKQRSLGEVLFISILAAAFHALSAGLIVGGTYILLGKFAAVSTQKLNIDLQIAAAVLLIGIGCSMIIPLVHSKLAKQKSQSEQKAATLWKRPLLVAFSIGVVPCPVTSVILIFCLTLGLIWQGVLLVISFAIGMGATLVAVSLLVWALKEKIIEKKLSTFQYIVTNILPLTGGTFLIIMGSIILQSLF